MKIILKLEEFMLLLLGFFLFMRMDLPWWWFFGLLLIPDIGMLGYLAGNKVGAFTYNILHHRGIAILLYLIGISYLNLQIFELAGIIMFSHAAMDRLFGYGLKYEKGFKFTHLGEIGKKDG
ncbi:DUF4260 domain-containing protein [Flagellimonas aquimarina]|uniref:DUF4260 domain-containing protein n=1 Tax=Flagellimonas aquimarina TaxID=2201895 RepID=A0A316L0L9_9FLAO|nr:DUF4260 domain-containing protein [Allomuricauda koreensis]PWL39446.1 DUF4260 domain-containing protein [Allomuricauda koreensis]